MKHEASGGEAVRFLRWLLTLGMPWHMGGQGRHWLIGCPVCRKMEEKRKKP